MDAHFCGSGYSLIGINLILYCHFSKPPGTVSVLIVGGALEALESQTSEVRLVLNRRKGFIKLALRFGIDLVPTFSFGEQFIFTQADNTKGNMW